MIYRKDTLLTPDTYTYHFNGGTEYQRDFVETWFEFFNYNLGFNFKRVDTGGLVRWFFRDDINSQSVVGKDLFERPVSRYPMSTISTR